MKVKKKWKKYVHQIALACLLICCVVQWMPENVFANDSSQLPDYDFKINSEGHSYHFELFKFDGSGRRVSFYYNNANDLTSNFTTAIISTVPISDSATRYRYSLKTDGVFELDKKSDETQHSFTFTYNSTKYYVTYYGMAVYYSPGDRSVYSGKLGAFYLSSQSFDSESESEALISDYIAGHVPYTCTLVSDGGKDGELSTDIGSVNNPIEDADIGCLVISKKKSSDLSGLGDNGNSDNKENLFRVRFGWKYKTNTGFSLQKNKYAQTFIQVRIQNRSVVYKNLSHTEIKRKLNSYGENAIIYSSLPVDHQPLVVTLTDTDFLKKYLPKYYTEINTPTNLTNALFLGNKYAFQFRVVCTDDLSVIPGNNTGAKWHCGRWTETSVDFDPVTPTDDEQKTGDIDDNGDFVQNEDDTTTKIDDASDKQYDSDDDASDDFNNSSKNNKDGFNWDSFKSLINQCKEVPGLIESIFSFLPGWVLVFVAVGFGIWIFVLIKRAIV